MKLTIKKEITIVVDVIVDYTAALNNGTGETPPDDSECEIEKVKFVGTDLTLSLKHSGFDLSALAQDALEEIENSNAYEGGQDE